ncbi:hypothetical protein ACI78Q_10320 [Geodermatophilus sp. SYSU D00705]
MDATVTGPSSRDADAAAPHRIRLITVHGIGGQEAGGTAARWADALIRFAEAAEHRVTVLSADLRRDPCIRVRLDPPVRPGLPHPPTTEVTVVEAHWADAFAEPSLSRVLRFLATIAPTLAVTQSILVLRQRTGLWPQHAAGGFVPAAGRVATLVLPLAAGIVALGVAAPVLAVVLLAAAVVALVPVPTVRKALGRGLGWMSTTIGDAYLFVADPVSRAAMESRLEARLTEKAAQGDPGTTVVLAHSQGAAVAYRTLSRMPPERRPPHLVTVGSGLGRLDDVSLLRRFPRYLTPLYLLIVVTGAWAVRRWDSWSWLLLAVSVALTAVVWWRCLVALDRLTAGPLEGLDGVAWLDIQAVFDPVPNGPAALEGGGEYRYVRVAGEQSVVRDHVRYERDFARTLPLLAGRLGMGRPAGPGGPGTGARAAPTAPGTDDGRPPLALRDWVGLGLRLLPPVAAVVAAVQTDLFVLGLWAGVAGPDPLDSLIGLVMVPLGWIAGLLAATWPHSPAPETMLGVLLLALLGLAGADLTRRVLTWLRDRETRRWLRGGGLLGEDGGRWRPWRWVVAFVPVVLVAAAVPALLLWRAEGPPWTPQEAVDAYLTAVADGNAGALCAVTTGTIEQLGRSDAACARSGFPGVHRSCADAREAVGELPSGAVSLSGTGGERTVTVTWVPEPWPTCSATVPEPVPVPARVVRAGDAWLVSAVGGPPGS